MTADVVEQLAYQLPTLQLWSPIKPSPKQLRWCLDPRQAAMFGGAAGGGKSAGQLMAALMYVDQPHYLRVFMTNLRRKLEDQPAQPRHLLTEIGVGYRLME